MSALLQVSKLCFCYGRERVLDNVNLSINHQEFVAIIGPNGGGKSTLAKLMAGLLTPHIGSITYTPSNARIGYVAQNTMEHLDFPISAYEVVMMGFLHKRFLLATREQKAYALEMMDRLGVSHLARRKIGALSGGERQRVLIARALCAKPDILILDEPTASIDLKGQEDIFRILQTLSARMSIVVISHDLSAILRYAHKIVYINKTAVLHDVPDVEFIESSGHFCEIDLFYQLTQSQKEAR
ncbi:metal ABC transporter ATP-binding protein [uncultured Helicobacter sp.]|uniref:metal ABC transporter ATP-binding protein n=1 Tax=uncultured Helicobacter sp. TaxID=175537 RepID=UPI0037537845